MHFVHILYFYVSGLPPFEHSPADDKESVVHPSHRAVQVGRGSVRRRALLGVRDQGLDGAGKLYKRFELSTFQLNFFFANPWPCSVAPPMTKSSVPAFAHTL